MKMVKGTEIIVRALREEGVKTLFAYPGGQAIDIFDALYGEKEFDIVLNQITPPVREAFLSIPLFSWMGFSFIIESF